MVPVKDTEQAILLLTALADYDKFQTKFATSADPRAYMFDQMTPAERQQTLSSFKDSGKRQAFISQVQRAEKNGVLSAPGPQNGQ